MQYETFDDECPINELMAENNTLYYRCNQINFHEILKYQLEQGWKLSKPMLNLINGE